jgi:hypothetical protein
VPLGPARARDYSRRPIALGRVVDEARQAEPLIMRDEVIALRFNVSDTAASAYGIEKFLEEDDGEEGADEG